ncbi:hypothetical protein [Streptomyces ipomoeae]|nr:hypothetical protein [Streptomyces ipomoeae]MDX2697472.1 hypothetical protein [Streptomyces ipomoeae]MDX2843201.1 hypothetical protein [Streptomyces ipomoeae]
MARYRVVGNHIVDTWGGGTILGELARDEPTRRSRSQRRLPKKVRTQIDMHFAVAAGVVLGCWLPLALWPA